MRFKDGILLIFTGLILMSGIIQVSALGASFTKEEKIDEFGLVTVAIADAYNIYSYEINLDYTNSITSVTHDEYLSINSSASYGHTTRDNVVSVYGSQTNSSRPGVSGDGDLFTLAYVGSLSLRHLVVIYTDGTTEYVYYNNSAATASSSSPSSGQGASPTAPTQTIPSEPGSTPPIEGQAPEKRNRFVETTSEVKQTIDNYVARNQLGYYVLILIPVGVALVAFIVYLIAYRSRKPGKKNLKR